MAVADAYSGGTPDRGLPDGEAGRSAPSICLSTPTKWQARTRVYQGGKLTAEGFPVEDISEYLQDDSAVIWLDLLAPDRADLAVLSEEFGLHPLAIEDAVHPHERTKIDRYRTHLFLPPYGGHLDPSTGELPITESPAFIPHPAVIPLPKAAA